MAITNKTYQSLCKRLGELDKERRQILQQLKQTPELGMKYLQDMLTSFVNQNSVKWFYRKGEKEGYSYWKLIGFTITDKTPKVTHRKKAILVNVDLEWEVYRESSNSKSKLSEQVKISAFNDVEGQVLNGRKEATASDAKKLIKLALTEKKNTLEEQLKALKAELANL